MRNTFKHHSNFYTRSSKEISSSLEDKGIFYRFLVGYMKIGIDFEVFKDISCLRMH